MGPWKSRVAHIATPLPSRTRASPTAPDGTAPLQRVLLRRGDFLLRDLRTLHRGTPNTTATPRPNMTITFAPCTEAAAAKGTVPRGIRRSVFNSLEPHAQWIWRAVKKVEAKPHAATGSNGYEVY